MFSINADHKDCHSVIQFKYNVLYLNYIAHKKKQRVAYLKLCIRFATLSAHFTFHH